MKICQISTSIQDSDDLNPCFSYTGLSFFEALIKSLVTLVFRDVGCVMHKERIYHSQRLFKKL